MAATLQRFTLRAGNFATGASTYAIMRDHASACAKVRDVQHDRRSMSRDVQGVAVMLRDLLRRATSAERTENGAKLAHTVLVLCERILRLDSDSQKGSQLRHTGAIS